MHKGGFSLAASVAGDRTIANKVYALALFELSSWLALFLAEQVHWPALWMTCSHTCLGV